VSASLAGVSHARGSWAAALRPLCEEACLAAKPPYQADVVRFYVARWCQKASGDAEPDPGSMTAEIRDAAAKIARNLAADGALVDRLVEGDADAWIELRRLLRGSARPRAGEQAREFADEAEQKIALILLTGTPPSRAAEQLRHGLEGPRNEYVFHSPFSYWARAVVINMIVDEQRRAAREREPPPPPSRSENPRLDRAMLEQARRALPGLLAAIRELPPVQHSVMVLSLSRSDLDEAIRARLARLAPDLFSLPEEDLPASDADIAERLATKPHSVRANRSAARRKLARRDPAWALLLDVLLPHKTTRPLTASTSERTNA
jgi:hypothetical protein